MKTYQPKKNEIERNWHLIDVKGEVLGRVSTKIAHLLMGKQKPQFSKHMDVGDYVVVINAKEVEVTGRKRKQKVYYKHSGYPGGLKEVKFEKLIKEQPEKVIEKAVYNMLPKNRLRQDRMRRFKIFAGSKHKYADKLKAKKK